MRLPFFMEIMKRALLPILVFFVAISGWAESLEFAIPAPDTDRVGEGIAVVFSPDLSTPGNRAFYETLGFQFFDSPNWNEVIGGIHAASANGSPVRLVVLETHGTNGNGLKLQEGKRKNDKRSYISIGALQERLEGSGVGEVLLSACNAGRLLRPEIYKQLNRSPGDPLFLPPTIGIIDASPEFDPAAAKVRILRRQQSGLETLVVGKYSELSLPLRSRVTMKARNAKGDPEFVVSTMLMQFILGEQIELTNEHEVKLSRADLSPNASEKIFFRFIDYLATNL